MSQYQLIVFDWDGTLMDSTAQIVSCMRQAMNKLQLEPLADDEISQIIGLGLYEAVQALYPRGNDTLWSSLADCYRQIWLSSPEEIVLFENARELLITLSKQDIFLAVATGKSRRGLNKVLESTGLGDYFIATRCADECHSKPHPQMLIELMDYTGVNAGQAIMIGDTEFDLMMARHAGTHALGITHGAHNETRLLACSPQAILHNLHQVERWLGRTAKQF